MVAVHTEGLSHPPICLFNTLFSCQCPFNRWLDLQIFPRFRDLCFLQNRWSSRQSDIPIRDVISVLIVLCKCYVSAVGGFYIVVYFHVVFGVSSVASLQIPPLFTSLYKVPPYKEIM
jgi:hypothetical protein